MAIIRFWSFFTGTSAEARSATGTTSMQSVVTYSGDPYALKANPTTSNNGYYRMGKYATNGLTDVSINAATTYVEFPIYFETVSTTGEEILSVLDSTPNYKASVRAQITGANINLKVYNSADTLVATGATNLAVNTWYWLGLKTTTSASASSYELMINGVSELSGTMTQRSTNVDSYGLGKGTNRASHTTSTYYGAGVVNDTGFLGVLRAGRLDPDGNGSTANWTGGTGSSNHLEVDETPTDDDTTYVKTSAAATHLFTLESCASAGITGTIHAVQLYTRLRRESGSGTSSTKSRIRSGGTNVDMAAAWASLTTFENRFQQALTDPNGGGALTIAGLDGFEVGVVEANSTVERCTSVALHVLFAPSTGDTSSLTTKAIAVDKYAPAATTTNKHLCALPVKAISVDKFAPTATNFNPHTASLTVKAVAVASSAPAATTTNKHLAGLTLKAATVASYAPGATVTERNLSSLTVKAVAVASNAPGAVTSNKNLSALPVKAVAVASSAPSAATTEKNLSSLVSKSVSVSAYAPSTTVTGAEGHLCALANAGIVLHAYAITAILNESAATPIEFYDGKTRTKTYPGKSQDVLADGSERAGLSAAKTRTKLYDGKTRETLL